MNIDIHTQTLTEVEKEIESLRAVAEYHRRKIREAGGAPAASSPATATADRQQHPNGVALKRQIDFAIQVLKSAGKPLKTREVADGMLRIGFPCDDVKRFKASIFTTLIRSPKVKKAGTGLWELKAD